ncbi:MAG TPA: carboxypeptidase regulatory-like domain-containing protein [Bryobacteraceae bacterium]|nr:carboxypeptidase regulatory-like domain-containing protein [Bryobacteraceae bacterium]
MTHWKRNFVLFATALLIAAMAWGQGATGIITGNVSDGSGAAIIGAKVTATNTGTAATTNTTTNETGTYRFVDLPTGMYTITVEATGFRKTTLSEQRLLVASTLRMDATLEVGEVNTSVTVESTAAPVNTEDAQLGQTMTQIDELPLLSGNGGRNALNLLGLQPGVSMTTAGSAGAVVGPFSVNGQRSQSNNFMLDGADSNDLAINVPDAVDVISPNALGEFRIVTGAMKAEYGRDSGAIIESTIKSGTNQFHGEATEVFRNAVLNANNFISNESGVSRPPFNLNDFDANVGGPIWKNKTFFFASYLGFRRVYGVTNTAQVFTNAERAAILASGVPAAQNVVNKLVPVANLGTNEFASAPKDNLQRDQGVLRLDHHFSDRNSFSASYFTERSTELNPFAFGAGVTLPGFGELDLVTYHNVALHDTHAFSPTVINEAIASFHRRDQPGVEPQNHITPASLGFTGIIPDDPSAAGPPFFGIGNIAVGNTYQGPQARRDNTWQYGDSVTWIKGRHTMKFGGEYRAYEQNQIFDFINNGYLAFDGSATQLGLVKQIPGLAGDDPVNDFANGYISSFYDQSNSNRQGYRDKFFSAYAQDDFKMTRNLTVNFGLRYDYGNPLEELRNRVSTFRPGQQSTVFPTAPIGLVFPGDTGISRSTYSPDKNNWGPRFGIAWDPTGKGKLVVRSGFGIFYNVPESELSLQFLGAAPYGAQVVAVGSTDMTHPYSSATITPPLAQNPFPFQAAKPGDKFDFTTVAPVSITRMDPKFQTPSAMQYSLDVQYEVAKNWIASVGFVGSQGRHLEDRRDIDPALPLPGATFQNEPLRNVYNINNPQDAAYGGAVFGGITNQLSDSNSSYSSLQLSLTKRTSYGLTMTNAYTYGHCIDNGSGLRTNSNPFSSKYDRGNCDTDIRHSYVGSVLYELPWFRDQKGFLGHVLGGFSVSTVVTLQTGLPFDIIDSGDRSLTGAGDDRPDYIGGTVHFVDPRDNSFGLLNSYFDGTGGATATGAGNPNFARVGSKASAAFGAGRYGTLGRNVFHGPGTLNTDFRLSKQIRITEHQSLTLRGEAFNFFNHTQFFNPDGNINDTTFGQVLTAHDPRLVQISAQFRF